MTPPLDLVECSHCHACFTAEATDELFHHATARCLAGCPDETQASVDPSPA